MVFDATPKARNNHDNQIFQNHIVSEYFPFLSAKRKLHIRNERVVIIGADARRTFQCTRKDLNQPPPAHWSGEPHNVQAAKETVRLMVGAVSVAPAA